MSRRALGGFILINVIVSLAVAFLALQVWDMLSDEDTADEPQVPQARSVVITATPRPGELPSSALEGTISALENQLAAAINNSGSSDGSAAQPRVPTVDNSPLPTPNASALPQGIPPLNPTLLANVTLPSDVDDAGQGTESDLPEVNGCERYTVEQGDTCIAIVDKFGVDLQELILLNGLNANCTDLQVDQQLLLPSESCGLPPTPTVTATVTNTPFPIGTFSITNTPIPTAINADVQIVQVLNFGDVTTEQVDIRNTSDAAVNMLGWTLREEGGEEFVFPDVLMQPGQVIRIFTRSGTNTPAALFWNQTTPVWTLGEIAVLSDAEEVIQSTFAVGGETINFDE